MKTELYILVISSFICAFWFSIYPLPNALLSLRPEWVTLVLIYWVLAFPQRLGVMTAWIVGLLLDGFEGTALGQHALSLAVVAYVTQILYQRVRMYAIWQQALLVFVLIGLKELLGLWVNSLIHVTTPDIRFLLPAFTSALMWPWMMILLRGLRRKMGIAKTS